MKVKLFVIIISLITASIFKSGGYGLWEKNLTIQGSIEVARPPELTRQFTEPALLPAISIEEPQAANISGSEGELDPEEEENTPDELNNPE